MNKIHHRNTTNDIDNGDYNDDDNDNDDASKLESGQTSSSLHIDLDLDNTIIFYIHCIFSSICICLTCSSTGVCTATGGFFSPSIKVGFMLD